RRLAEVALVEAQGSPLLLGPRQGRAGQHGPDQDQGRRVDPSHRSVSLDGATRDASELRGSPSAGRETVQTVPRPGALPRVMRPPWAWTMLRAMLRPSPVPPCSRARALSTR